MASDSDSDPDYVPLPSAPRAGPSGAGGGEGAGPSGAGGGGPPRAPERAAAILVRSMLSAGGAHARYRRNSARMSRDCDGDASPPPSVDHVYSPPEPSQSLHDFRAVTRIEAEGHNGKLGGSFLGERVEMGGSGSSTSGASSSGGMSGSLGKVGKVRLGRKAGIAKTCPLQSIAHHALRKLDAIALGRHVPRAAIAASVLPTKLEPVLLARLSGRIYNARFIGDHGLFVASAQNRVVRTYDFGNRNLPVMTNSIYCHDASWTVSDVDVGFEGGATGSVPKFLVYSSLNNVVQMVDMQQEGALHTQEPLDFSPTGDVRTVWSIQLAGDNSRLLAGTGMSSPSGLFRFAHNPKGGITVFDMERRQILYNFHAHDNDTNSVTYLNRESDPNLLLSGADDGLAHLWDTRAIRRAAANGSKNKPVCTFVGHSHGLTHLDSRNDGRFFISSSKDCSIKLWDVRRPSSSDPSQWKIRRDVEFDYRFASRPARTPKQPEDLTDASVITYKGAHTVLKTLIRARFSPRATTGQRYIQTGKWPALNVFLALLVCEFLF